MCEKGGTGVPPFLCEALFFNCRYSILVLHLNGVMHSMLEKERIKKSSFQSVVVSIKGEEGFLNE